VTVYVDDMRRPAKVGRTWGRWSHLMADTSEELHQFAARLGLRREWVQHESTAREHYDVTDAKREQALSLGAVPISYPRGVGELLATRREVPDDDEPLGYSHGPSEWGYEGDG
jgi:hypothetical protein